MARGSRDDAALLFDAVENLLTEKLYHSAVIVGGILLSRASMPSQQSQREGGLHAEALSMFADALKGKGEHKRATVREQGKAPHELGGEQQTAAQKEYRVGLRRNYKKNAGAWNVEQSYLVWYQRTININLTLRAQPLNAAEAHLVVRLGARYGRSTRPTLGNIKMDSSTSSYIRTL